jgi:hypothetical protein
MQSRVFFFLLLLSVMDNAILRVIFFRTYTMRVFAFLTTDEYKHLINESERENECVHTPDLRPS